jgi:cyanophycinase
MVGVIQSHPEMLGIGLDESTAIVVTGDEFEVIGSSYVLVYDNERWVEADAEETFRTVGGPFYFLRAGDTYNLKTREALRPTTTREPIGRVIRKSWSQP